LADDQDLFWIAEVTDADDKKVALHYYHYTINRNGEKMYKPHNFTRSYRSVDLISHFFTEDFAKPTSKKYRKNTTCTLEKKYSKF
jgi:hypothetical protein